MKRYQVQIDVCVTDNTLLRAYALTLALKAGIPEADFNSSECDDPEDNVEYWLGWCFDAGTPPNCGFEIEDSRTVYEGGDDCPFHPESPEGRAWTSNKG